MRAQMKIYKATRKAETEELVVKVVEGTWTSHLKPRYDLRNHSPSGFECGYLGSGPAQLALALCADALDDDDRARRVYQAYKMRVVVALPKTGSWQLEESDVRRVCEELEAERARPVKEDELEA